MSDPKVGQVVWRLWRGKPCLCTFCGRNRTWRKWSSGTHTWNENGEAFWCEKESDCAWEAVIREVASVRMNADCRRPPNDELAAERIFEAASAYVRAMLRETNGAAGWAEEAMR
jgi:hypothetical protein